MMLSWKDLKQLSPQHITNVPSDGAVAGVDIDSRRIDDNMIFIARRGEKTDGHKFVATALQNGAGAAIVENRWFATAAPASDWPLVVVDDSDQALRDLAGIVRNKFDGPVLGITGSNGKTTTKEMITHVLSQDYSVLSTPGNFNNLWGLPLSILQSEEHHDFWVLEHGMNEPGEIAELCKISQPTAGIITTISEVHSVNFDSVQGIADTKYALYKSLPKDGFTFQNVDDDFVRNMQPVSEHVVTYGIENSANIQGKILGVDEFSRVTLQVEPIGTIQLRVYGEFQAMNALAAATVGLTYGIDDEDIKQALEAFTPIPGRATVIDKEDYTIIDDSYNANPVSMRTSIDLLEKMPVRGRRIAILGDMLELSDTGEEAHKQLGHYASTHGVDILIGVGDLAKLILDGSSGDVETHYFPNYTDCVKAIHSIVKPGDAILVKGSHGIHLENVVEVL